MIAPHSPARHVLARRRHPRPGAALPRFLHRTRRATRRRHRHPLRPGADRPTSVMRQQVVEARGRRTPRRTVLATRAATPTSSNHACPQPSGQRRAGAAHQTTAAARMPGPLLAARRDKARERFGRARDARPADRHGAGTRPAPWGRPCGRAADIHQAAPPSPSVLLDCARPRLLPIHLQPAWEKRLQRGCQRPDHARDPGMSCAYASVGFRFRARDAARDGAGGAARDGARDVSLPISRARTISPVRVKVRSAGISGPRRRSPPLTRPGGRPMDERSGH